MGKIVGDTECPGCASAGRDSTGNHLILFEEGSYCNKCMLCFSEDGTILNSGLYDYEGAVPQAPRDTEEAIPFSASGSFDNIGASVPSSTKDPGDFNSEAFRGISETTRAEYGVTTELGTNGLPVAQYYPVTVEGSPHTYKKRTLPKDFLALKPWKGLKVDLFGQHIFGGGKKILITEGEEDAMAAREMFRGSRYCKDVACVSLPTGANVSAITNNLPYLKKFTEIIFCPDQDEAGKSVTKDIAKLLPDILIMNTGLKDACEMLGNGKQGDFVNDFFKAERYKPSSIITAASVKAAAIKPVKWGLSYPWEPLTKMTYGLRTRQIIGIGAGPGAGKTTFIQGIQNHIVTHHKAKIGIFSLEETPEFSLKKLAGSQLNLPIHLPDCKYDEDDVSRIIDDYEGKVFFYDHSGYKDFDDIEEAIRFLALDGVKYFFIDPLSALTAHLSSSEANDYLNAAMLKMSSLVNQHDCTIFHVNHLNNPPGSKDHGEGAKVRAGQFSGSRSMWKFSTSMWGLVRDQLAEDEGDRNLVDVVLLKDRLSGSTGSFKLEYNPAKGILEDTPGAF